MRSARLTTSRRKLRPRPAYIRPGTADRGEYRQAAKAVRRASGLRNGARRVAFDNVAAGFSPPMCLLGRQAPAKLARSIQLPKEAGATAQKVIVMAVDNRHGDKRGEISQKHGNTLIRTLRQTYGAHFAKDCADDDKLTDV